MSNSLLTPTEVTRESLRILHGNSAMLKAVNKAYDDRFAQSGAKIGDSLLIRKPNKYTVRTGRVMSICLHPFVIGHPHRSKYLDKALAHIRSHQEVWITTGAEIIDWYRAQTPAP